MSIPTPDQPMTPDGAPIDLGQGAAPIGTEEFEDYFSGFGGSRKFMMPDKIQFIEFQVMNEGQKAKFQRETRSAINISRKTENASIMPDPARERHALIKSSVCDWNIYTKNKNTGEKVTVVFNTGNLQAFLDRANPKIVEDLESEIRKANPWMVDEITIQDIDEQIEELTQLRAEKEQQLAEKS